MAQIEFTTKWDTYDCSIANKASTSAPGDLAINLIVFDEISFAAAKTIDLAWNILAGRGFQVLAAFICYRLFTGILYLLIELQSVSAETFSALAFSTTSLLSFGPIVKTIHRGKLGPFNTFAVIWILISIAYLLFIVTMADLMTGYMTSEMTWLKFPNGTLLETRTMNFTVEHAILNDVIHDPKPPENVTMPNNVTISPDWSMEVNMIPTAIVISSSDSKNGTMLFEQCLDVNEMGMFWADAYFDVESGGDWFASGDYRATDPTRQKLLTKYPSASCMNRYMLGLQDLFQRPNYMPNTTWWTDKNNFRCLPSTDYAWGFSYQYTILLTSVNSIWLLITAVLWLLVETKSQSLQKRGAMGTWRAVLDLASAVQDSLGRDTGGYTEVELEKAVRKLQPLTYDVCADDATGTERISLRECDENNECRKKKFTLRWKTKYC
ncbi:hypothetical protein KCU91_g1479, partial [Aureobasidium melanogenum]